MKQYIKPPKKWRMPVAILLGAFIGLSIYLFKVSNATSYLSDAPETCINCHVMVPEYASWNHSSHREHANCNDCHVPHDNMIHKYYFKAGDGIRHATMFTLRKEPEVIKIKEAGIEVVQNNCKRCHGFVNENISANNWNIKDVHSGNGKLCWDCHREVPHGKVHSLSSTPNVILPQQKIKTPDWIKKQIENRK
ncbi:MAG: cytochrome c nitrite reductase small subunit [Bacteroidales bacterium]|nr:cytochrome c nitrite reductase small subunit [Bacteroidales bacterium]